MEIRTADKNDIEGISSMWEMLDDYNLNELHQDKVFRNGNVGGKDRYISLLNDIFDDASSVVVVCKVDDKYAAFVTCSVVNQFGNGVQDAIIDVTFVDSSFRGMGIGTKIYEFLEKLLKSKGVVGITTEVFDNNEMSLNFHKKMGYEAIATAVEVYKKL